MEKRLDESFHEVLMKLANKSAFDINVGDMAKVVSYDKSRHVADVLPLVDDAGGKDEVGVINECPVLYNCYAADELYKKISSKIGIEAKEVMKVGATVYIAFNNRDLDEFDGGKYSKSSERMHDINDAVVVGVHE